MADELTSFLDCLRALETAEEMVAALTRVLAALGFAAFTYGHGRISSKHVMSMDLLWSVAGERWIKRYAEKPLSQDTLLLQTVFEQTAPLTYREILSLGSITPRAADIERKFGFRSGIVVPIHGSSGSCGVLSVASKMPLHDFERVRWDLKAKIQLVATAFHDRVLALRIGPDPAPASGPPPSLTDRESECLGWAAVGKTNRQIGNLLGLSERTAKKHIESAMHKLRAKTRTQAAVKAVAQGLIKS